MESAPGATARPASVPRGRLPRCRHEPYAFNRSLLLSVTLLDPRSGETIFRPARPGLGRPLPGQDRPQGEAEGAAFLLDAGRDGGGDLDGAANRAKPVMRFLHNVRQYRPGLIALRSVGERDPERHLDIGEMVASLVAHLFRVDDHLERVWFGPARGHDVHIDGGATADRAKQQLRGGEVDLAAAEGYLATSGVGDGELAVRDAPDGHVAVHRPSRHTAYPARAMRPGSIAVLVSSPGRGPGCGPGRGRRATASAARHGEHARRRDRLGASWADAAVCV